MTPPSRLVLRGAAPLVLLAGTLYAGFRSVGSAPALGPFLHPTTGVWAVAAAGDLPAGTITVPGVRDTVRVVFDARAVPHVFARNVEDVYRALGYLHARFRLFQLELTARAAEGTMTEWLGDRALAFDRGQRTLGLEWSAERSAAALDTATEVGRIILAYAAGVNARIAELRPRDLPLEFRLLGVQPRPWRPLYTFLFVKQMGYTLAYAHPDRRYERLAARVGTEAARALIAVNSPIQEPIVPGRRHSPPGRIPPPRLSASRDPDPAPSRPAGASNNWVVAPGRTANGYALLAGDPHLDLTLPSVWYEAHLVVPGSLDVYGVTFPSAPGVPIGFNRDVAWSFTSTGADVLDYYRETLDDPEHPARYRLDGQWRPLERQVAEYRDPRGRLLATDTLYYTHRGPLRIDSAGARSIRWTVLDRDMATAALLDIASARDVDEWMAAMESFLAPIQNGAVADRAGNIAILSAGAYPVRAGDGSGLEPLDGTTTASDWRGFLPASRYPRARNPVQGFLASANQQPVDPANDPTYFGADWVAPWRALRINALLRRDSTLTPEALRLMQTDPGSARADRFVPAFLDAVASTSPALVGPEATEAARLLDGWDRRYTRENERAVLFEAAMDALDEQVWDELLVSTDSAARRIVTPGDDVLAALLDDRDNLWWDDRRTADVVETRDVVLVEALIKAYRDVRERYGEAADGGWRWERVQHANIYHLLRFPALSALDLPVQGGPGTISPFSGRGTHGPSWRMVVELGADVHGWGVFPGGQSGNPMSPWYRDRLDAWLEGRLDPLPFPAAPDALPTAQTAGRVRLVPERP